MSKMWKAGDKYTVSSIFKRGKLAPVIIKVPYHEDKLGDWRYSSTCT